MCLFCVGHMLGLLLSVVVIVVVVAVVVNGVVGFTRRDVDNAFKVGGINKFANHP